MYMVSACLLGFNCKYNGENNLNADVLRWLGNRPVIAVCPEVFGGLPVPRRACEIRPDTGGVEALDRVVTGDGADLTAEFERGADACVALARMNQVEAVILKQRSPSCGCGQIYDGGFSGRLIPGNGITARRLIKAGFKVFSEDALPAQSS
ncbi:MAG: DUF523 domain-containing protein [Solirubrobacterales bacterium]